MINTECRLNMSGGSVPVVHGWKMGYDDMEDRFIKPLCPDQIGIISDSHVFVLYGQELESFLMASGHEVTSVVLEPGESSKSLEVVDGVYGRLSESCFSRHSLLIALGGGVVGDIAGFIAGTYMRGIPFIQIPTSLMAQVDSSIGGKVGVNHWSGKNLIGLFHHPCCIWIDSSSLETLRFSEIENGFGEIIKYGMVLDTDIYNTLNNFPDIQSVRSSPEQFMGLISRCIRCKTNVVELDEREKGYRRILNFGHTIGHALEAVTGYSRLQHGIAITWGMVMAQELGKELGMVDPRWADTSTGLIRRMVSLPSLDDISIDDFMLFLVRDKKQKGGRAVFVLSSEPGRGAIKDEIDMSLLYLILRRYLDQEGRNSPAE